MMLNSGKEIHLINSLIEWLFAGGRWLAGVFIALWGLVAPIHTIIICAMVAVGIDFLTGNAASYMTAKRSGGKEKYRLDSDKMWKSVWKLGLTVIGCGFAWMLDTHVFPVSIYAPHLLASFILGAEFVSFLENAYVITEWNGFNSIKSIFKDKMKDNGVDLDRGGDNNLV